MNETARGEDSSEGIYRIKTVSWIEKIAYYRNIRNEVPNQELARELAGSDNTEGIKEISEYLFDKNRSVSSDCLKVLYEIGYLKPELIQDYVDTFLRLLESKVNRMVWGSMIALATIAHLKPAVIYKKIDLVLAAIKKGTVITEVWGIKTLVKLALDNTIHKDQLLPVIMNYLEKCRPVDFASRVETILPVITGAEEQNVFDRIIEMKVPELTGSQAKKLRAVLKKGNRDKEK